MVLLSELDPSRDLLSQVLEATEEANKEFLSRLGTSKVPATAKSLFVMQGEKALCKRSTFEYVGSEDATTCVVILMQGDGYVYVAHVDEYTARTDYEDGLRACTGDLTKPMKLYLSGGYEGDVTSKVINSLYEKIHELNIPSLVDMALCCCSKVNLRIDGFPKTRSLVLDINNGLPLPTTFEHRGPEIYRRHANRSFGGGYVSLNMVFNPESEELVLKGFNIRMSSSTAAYTLQRINLARSNPNEFLLTNSTSPLHESEMFIPDMIGMLEFELAHRNQIVHEQRYKLVDTTWKIAK